MPKAKAALSAAMIQEKAFARRLDALKRRISMIEAVMDFLKKHPDIAPRCKIRSLWYGPGLEFEEKAFVKVSKPKGARVRLRLERFIKEDSATSEETSVIYKDIYQFSREQLARVFRQVKIDLRKPPDYDEDNADGVRE
jgi:hypothetical protein